MDDYSKIILDTCRYIRDNTTADYVANTVVVDAVITAFEAIENTFEDLVAEKIYNELVLNNAWTANITTWIALITTPSVLRVLVNRMTTFANPNMSALDLETFYDNIELLSF